MRVLFLSENMLLRSASTPILNSWPCISKDFHSQDPDPSKTPSSIHISPQLSSASNPTSKSLMKKSSSESDLRSLATPSQWRPQAPYRVPPNSIVEEEEVESDLSLAESLDRMLSASGLNELMDGGQCGVEPKEKTPQTMNSGGGGGFGICDGGGRCGGGGDGNGSFGFPDSNNGDNVTDAYYQNMIEANPGNALLLGNYARFLMEVKGDLVKAEEYCSRAILANPGDANVLALYADLIWQTQKDTERAEAYFDQAIQADPNDCYVMASYARFLWSEDAEEEDVEAQPPFIQSPPTASAFFAAAT